MDPLAASLARSPELFPLDIDPATDQVTLIRLTEADYRQASFLDGRILTLQSPRRVLPWTQLEAAVAVGGFQESAGYIFHIGHVGSTLLSRLVGAHPQALALREPAVLRTFAHVRSRPASRPTWSEAEFGRRFGAILKLLSRSFRPQQRTIVKATSFVSELAASILTRASQPRAIFMFVPAETYLATILGAPNSPKEARLLAESRLGRLHRRIGDEPWNLATLSEGEMVAMSWACEMTALAAAQSASARAMWLNFDRFLNGLAPFLGESLRHFGIDAAQDDVDAILSGPELGRYAKAPEYAYDAGLRSQVLGFARKERSGEIAHGLTWLNRAAIRSEAIASILHMR